MDARGFITGQLLSTIAQKYKHIDQTVVLGRGYNYCTAFEWALN